MENSRIECYDAVSYTDRAARRMSAVIEHLNFTPDLSKDGGKLIA